MNLIHKQNEALMDLLAKATFQSDYKFKLGNSIAQFVVKNLKLNLVVCQM